MNQDHLSHQTLLKLKRWNTPTIYNGWEQITRRDASKECFNLEETVDFMPELGPIVGYAVTVVIRPGDASIPVENPDGWSEYRKYVASVPGPKIVVVQDLDKPHSYGAYWGEVNSNIHRALGCVGSITDGALRDVDEIRTAGFKVIARRMCVGHACSFPLKWNCEVEVFGTKVKPGQLIHADKHGFLAIPKEDEKDLLEAAIFMDENECNTMISSARASHGKPLDEILREFDEASAQFGRAAQKRFQRKGEW
jgi:regulator of RNase E activity RraA